MKLTFKECKIAVIIILGTFSIAFIIGKVTNSDLGYFPFDSNVWGTFSDYLMITLTTFSLYVIYRTLLMQIASIKDQSDSIKTQTEQLRLSIMDRRKDFKVKIEAIIELQDDEDYYKISFLNKLDHNQSVKLAFHSNPLIFDELIGKVTRAKNSFKPIYLLGKNQSITVVLREPINDYLTITLNYRDYYGFKYLQTFIFFKDGTKSNGLIRHLD